MISGAPWLPKGEKREIGINSLIARILCARHNSALSPLDNEAGRFFRAIRAAQEDVFRRSLSRRPRVYLFSGEAIELWMLKTLWGFFQSGLASIEGKQLVETHSLDPMALEHALRFGIWPERCGFYSKAERGSRFASTNDVSFGPIIDDSRTEIPGCILKLAGVDFKLVLDARVVPWAEADGAHSYRPTEFVFRNNMRRHIVELTWPPGVEVQVIEMTAALRPK